MTDGDDPRVPDQIATQMQRYQRCVGRQGLCDMHNIGVVETLARRVNLPGSSVSHLAQHKFQLDWLENRGADEIER